MRILAIETSCDDTGISILEVKISGKNDIFRILANNTNSQIKIHAEYGGVFPALAKREHQKNLPIIFEKTLKQAKIKIEKIDLITVTYGPGLEPALWTGIVFAKELGDKYKIPIVPVNHMEGHIFSIFPQKGKTFTVTQNKKIFPVLSLLVSGGHTELVLVKNFMKYKKIGGTRDDASGEAFDKVARMLGLPYPGGPEISRLADQARKLRIKNEKLRIKLPRPMMYSKDYDFSFSGLKTAVLYLIRDLKKEHSNILQNDKMIQTIAREFEDAVVEVLVHKTIKAIKQYKIKTLIVGGGVSANSYLQKQMKLKIKKEKLQTEIHFPSRDLTGDNALMIGIAGYFQYKYKKTAKNSKSIKAIGNLSL
ncbi:MAG: tRNA (adenosine(37)-N6)-threonylcarbamoyltransferase complex transferase subunit TsaD [Candidatus Paceibacterota bacterium]|jgi:N6-L-threonylcarbamoyladenine synthase